MKLNNKKGISLIVLVITIIVMIILAAAIILSLQSSGIIGRANEAKTASDVANAKQVVAMATAEWQLMEASEQSKYSNSFSKYAESKLTDAGYKVGIDKDITLSEDGAINTVYIDKNGDKAIIPEGFSVSKVSTEQTIETGLVIVDQVDNEFVWVPVANYERFERTTTYKVEENITAPDSIYTEPYSYDTTITNVNDLTGEYAEYAAMKTSVQKYSGFYIARYEAGKGGEETVVSKKNVKVWNSIPWGESLSKVGTEGAVYRSRQMYKNSKSVVSTLCYGVQWDSTLQFIATRGIKDVEYVNESTEKGYYGLYSKEWNEITSEDLKVTGSNEQYSVNNIYDMAGNATEWTMEAVLSTYRVLRGGYKNYMRESYSASDRSTIDGIVTQAWGCFRISCRTLPKITGTTEITYLSS